MKTGNRMKSLLVMVVVLSMLLMAACTQTPTTPAETTYKVTVADAQGAPYTTGVVVRFLKDGQQVAMQAVNENGVAEKALATGDYTVELTFTGDADAYYYDKNGLTLTAEKPELTVTLASKAGEAVPLLYGDDGTITYAQDVAAGSTYVELEQGRNYFLFTPQVAGTYQFTTTDANAVIGYYGAPHFVQEMSAAEVVDNAFSLSISANMIGTNGTGTTVIVVGIDAAEESSCMLSIVRTGDPEHSIADEPWIVYETKAELNLYALPEGAVLGEFDLTANYTLVYNEEDGFYHMNTADGPLVLVHLVEDSKYLSSFNAILEKTGVVKYFFDEEDNFVKKESYSECLMDYIQNSDEERGLYPLTEDLKYIIQQTGDHNGWFDESESLYLFKDADGNPLPGINPETSWLFMCCYIAN